LLSALGIDIGGADLRSSESKVSDEEVADAVKDVLQSQVEPGSVTKKKLREKLEERFQVSLHDRRGIIGRELTKHLKFFQKEQSPLRATPSKQKAPKGISNETMQVVSEKTLERSQKSDDKADPAEVKSEEPKKEAPLVKRSLSGLSTAKKPVDTRHKQESLNSDGKIALAFPKSLANTSGSYLPVLVELNKRVNLKGDSGAVGRISILDPKGRSHPAVGNKTKKSKEKTFSKFGKGSVVCLDLKGDTFECKTANSVSLMSVSVVKDKGAKVDAVFNTFLQGTFKGNVMETMAGKHISQTGSDGNEEEDDGSHKNKKTKRRSQTKVDKTSIHPESSSKPSKKRRRKKNT